MSSKIGFSPAESVLYTDNSQREYEFKQEADGTITGRVYFGLKEINVIPSNQIVFETNAAGLQQPRAVSAAQMSPQECKSALVAFKKLLEADSLLNQAFQPINGAVTDVTNHRNGARFHRVDGVTIVI